MPLLPQSTVLVRRGLRRGFQSAWKGKRPGTTAVLFACLFALLQLLMLGSIAAQTVRSTLISKGDLYIEVRPGARDQDVQELYASIRALPYVSGVEYVPKDKAYEREKLRNPDMVAMLERFKLQNPYPDSFSVTLASLSDYPSFSAFVTDEQWNDTVDPSFLTNATTQEQDIHRLLAIATAVRLSVFLLTGLSALCIVVCVGELIARRARGHGGELVLETLLGGSSERAMIPYVAEVTTVLGIGLVAGSALAFCALLLLPLLAREVMTDPSFALVRTTFHATILSSGLLILAGEIVLLPLLAYAGTAWGMRGVEVK
jgi:cell division protein FtsX